MRMCGDRIRRGRRDNLHVLLWFTVSEEIKGASPPLSEQEFLRVLKIKLIKPDERLNMEGDRCRNELNNCVTTEVMKYETNYIKLETKNK